MEGDYKLLCQEPDSASSWPITERRIAWRRFARLTNTIQLNEWEDSCSFSPIGHTGFVSGDSR